MTQINRDRSINLSTYLLPYLPTYLFLYNNTRFPHEPVWAQQPKDLAVQQWHQFGVNNRSTLLVGKTTNCGASPIRHRQHHGKDGIQLRSVPGLHDSNILQLLLTEGDEDDANIKQTDWASLIETDISYNSVGWNWSTPGFNTLNQQRWVQQENQAMRSSVKQGRTVLSPTNGIFCQHFFSLSL